MLQQRLNDAAIALHRILDKENINFGIFGGYAIAAVGGVRESKDIDCLASVSNEQIIQLLNGKEGLGCCEDQIVNQESSDDSGSPGLCTNISFAYPGWEVTDLHLTNDQVDFHLANNAKPDSRTSCSANNALLAEYHECNIHQTWFLYDSTSTVLTINQTWTCEESNLTFVGIGNVTLGYCSPNSPFCSVPNSNTKTVPASLLAPVQITPKPLQPPPGANTTGCTHNSQTPAWKVSNLYYQRLNFGPPCSPVSGECPPSTLYYGLVEFDLFNTATVDKRHCGAEYLGLSDLETGYDDWLLCDAGLVFFPSLAPPTKEYETTTFFRFNHSSNTLELNQTWYCADVGDDEEYRFSAYGAVSPALDPGVGYIGNMTVPQVRVNGSSQTLVVTGTAVTEEILAPNTLQRPQAFGRSCTVTSLLDPPKSFRIHDFLFSTYWKDAKARTIYVYMSVTNWMFNNALTFDSEGDAMTSGVEGASYPDVWYGCNGGSFSAPVGSVLLNCSFAFDRMANWLSVREDWVCADKDQEHPILFTAVARGIVAMNDSLCQTSRSTGEFDDWHCPGPETFDITVTDFTWRSCAPGDNCPTTGSGFNWEEQFG